MDTETRDKLVRAALLRALDLFDAAWGKPFDAKPLALRVQALLPAVRGLQPEMIEWARDAALATLERHPSPHQLRRLAQASPTYQAQAEAARRATRQADDDADPARCDECQEPRARHRYRYAADQPRPLECVVIRHRPGCTAGVGVAIPFVDPPRFGQLQLDGASWDEERGGDLVHAGTGAAVHAPTPQELEQRRAGFRALAAQGGGHV